MRRSTLLLACLAVIAAMASARVLIGSRRSRVTFPEPTPIASRTKWDQLENYSFEDFTREYKKTNLFKASADYEFRRSVFEKNLAAIKLHNSDPNRTYNQNVNHFADMTPEELQAHFMGYNQGVSANKRNLKTAFAPEFPNVVKNTDIPKSLDWREKGVTTPVKNQGQCGSCWAFAAVAAYESHAALATGKLVTLSTQQVTSCSPNPDKCGGTGGCEGATAEIAYDHTALAGGITAETSYPYTSGRTSRTGTCMFPNATMPPVFTNKGYVQLPTNDLNSVLEHVQKGPMVISVAASGWAFYDSGIFSECSKNLNNVDVNHAVVLEGYGETAASKYWVVRNSWGPNWGENGYMRLLRRDVEVCGTDPTPEHGYVCEGGPTSLTVCGECGMLSDTSYPSGISVA